MDITDGTTAGPPGQDRQSSAPVPAEASAGGSGSDAGAPGELGGPREMPIHPRLLAMIMAAATTASSWTRPSSA